jgi:PAS domain S-box-containing protein
MEVKVGSRTYLVSLHPFEEEYVNIYGFDISEQKELEENLRKAYENLQVQSEELQAQSKDLQMQNEELSDQSHELQRITEILRESEEKYRNIIETANEGIWIYDTDIKFTYVNIRMTEMLGYSRYEIIGSHAWDFMDEVGKVITQHNLEKRRQGINDVHEFKLIHKNGSPLHVLSSSKALINDSGKFMGALSMYTDITERKKAEEALQKVLADLYRISLVKKVQIS